MLNKMFAMGRLTRDPELRRTQTGKAVCSFCIACDRDFNKGETDFFDCVAWGQTGEFISNYFAKGRMIVVVGSLQKRAWNDKNGNRRETAEIVADHAYFADSKAETGTNRTEATRAPAGDFSMLEDEDTQLPF